MFPHFHWFLPRSKVQFGMNSADMIQQESHIQVVSKNLYNQEQLRVPVAYGVLDRRMVRNPHKFAKLFSITLQRISGNQPEGCNVWDLQSGTEWMYWSLWVSQFSSSGLPRWPLSLNNHHPSVNLQSESPIFILRTMYSIFWNHFRLAAEWCWRRRTNGPIPNDF